jgi:hypothetical protein
MIEEDDDSEPLKDVLESDQAVEPDAKVAEELRILSQQEDSSEKEEKITAYAIAKIPLLEYVINKKREQRLQKETTILTNVSRQLDKQTTETERISSVLLHSIHKYIKYKARPQQQKLIKQVQKQTSQVQKYVTKKKKEKRKSESLQ